MIKKLKIKMILVIMSLLTIVFIVVIASINIFQAKSNREKAMSFLKIMSESDGLRAPFPEGPGYQPENNRMPSDIVPIPIEEQPAMQNFRNMDFELFNRMHFYGVKLDANMEIIEYINDQENLYTSEDIDALLETVLNKNSDSGTIGNQYYLSTEKDYGHLILFMDNTIAANSSRNLLNISFLIGGISMVILFLLSLFLSNWLVKPIDEAFVRQKQFIADASHEFKTPIAVIQTNSEVLVQEIGNNKWLSYIRAEASRMNKLVTDLLTLARLDSDADNSGFEPFNLSMALMNVVLPFESFAFEEEITFEYSIADNLVFYGSETQWKQLGAILIENAFKYCDKGGTVSISLMESNHGILLKVYNSGQWIEKSDIPKIFSRFYRSDQARSRIGNSYGLGLSIARSIVDQHGGHIEVESNEGAGTRFIVVLKTG